MPQSSHVNQKYFNQKNNNNEPHQFTPNDNNKM